MYYLFCNFKRSICAACERGAWVNLCESLSTVTVSFLSMRRAVQSSSEYRYCSLRSKRFGKVFSTFEALFAFWPRENWDEGPPTPTNPPTNLPPWSNVWGSFFVACVASVSVGFSATRSRRFSLFAGAKIGRAQHWWKQQGGGGEARKGNACPQTPWFWKTPLWHFRSWINSQCDSW